MKKTIALFGLALSLLLTALAIGIREPRRPEGPTPPPGLVAAPPTPAVPLAAGSSLSIGDLVRLDASLSNGLVRAGEGGALSLLVDLVAKEVGTQDRPPMAVALVIDRSGSMQGEKIRQARQAAKQFVDRLSDDDQVAVITYSSDASTDLPLTALKGQRDRVRRIIDEILDGGGTDIGSGLNAGLAALRGSKENAVRRLLLVSDGNANQGITDPNALAALARGARQDSVTVSTLGVGVDFNEDLLALMSQSAGGGYYYARNAEAIAAAFDKELTGLTKIAARNVEIGLELGPSVGIREVYGYRTEMKRGRKVITIGDMSSGERRRVMIELSTDRAPEGPVTLGTVVLAYNAAGSETAHEHQGSMTIVSTTREDEIARGERPDVREAFEAAQAAKAREAAAFSFQSGKKEEAIKNLQLSISSAKRKNIVLNSAVIGQQVQEMEDALRTIQVESSDSDSGKDIVKREKLRAREVFAY